MGGFGWLAPNHDHRYSNPGFRIAIGNRGGRIPSDNHQLLEIGRIPCESVVLDRDETLLPGRIDGQTLAWNQSLVFLSFIDEPCQASIVATNRCGTSGITFGCSRRALSKCLPVPKGRRAESINAFWILKKCLMLGISKSLRCHPQPIDLVRFQPFAHKRSANRVHRFVVNQTVLATIHPIRLQSQLATPQSQADNGNSE